MRGITLLALGDPAYGKFAWNLLASIKFNSPELPIQLIHDGSAIRQLNNHQLACYDHLTVMEPEDYYLQGKFMPGLAKLSLYKYLKFEETLYLDVDAAAVNPLHVLFDNATQDYHAQTSDSHLWASPEELKKHFGVEGVNPINSSLQFIRKGKTTEKIYAQARAELVQNTLSPSQHLTKWYSGQPDELYMNVTLSKLQIVPGYQNLNPMFCTWRTAGRPPTLGQIKNGHQLIGFWGHPGNFHNEMLRIYDTLMGKYMKALYGLNHHYKIHQLLRKKV